MSMSRMRGDTIVEVMFAFAVFGMVAVGAFMLANRATASLQSSLEITLVREQMDAQAETLRFLNQSYVTALASGATVSANSGTSATPSQLWRHITTNLNVSSASAFGASGSTTCPSIPTRAFALNPSTVRLTTGSIQSATVFSEVVGSSARGIWIQAVNGSGATASTRYFDFHIRTCWPSAGSNVQSTLATVVRLYEPIQ